MGDLKGKESEIKELFCRAGELVAGVDNGYIGAYMINDDQGSHCGVAEGGGVGTLTFLIAKIILAISATHQVKPMLLLHYVRKALKLMIKYYKKGLPIGEIEERSVETH